MDNDLISYKRRYVPRHTYVKCILTNLKKSFCVECGKYGDKIVIWRHPYISVLNRLLYKKTTLRPFPFLCSIKCADSFIKKYEGELLIMLLQNEINK